MKMTMSANRLSSKSRSSFAAFKAAPIRSTKASARVVVVEARAPAVGVGLMGTKAGMMSYFTESGECVPATVIALEEGNIVTQVLTEDVNGYNAVQVGYKAVEERKVAKPVRGHCAKAGAPALKHLKEWRLKDKSKVESYKPGQQLDPAEMFKAGDAVDVAGTSIGKGFQGSIKRWNMVIGPMSHGSKSHRQHGSIGASTTPQRVFPGLKMAGHMGNERVTSKNLEILKVDVERRAIVVKGCVPGKAGSLVEIAPAKFLGKNW